MADRREPVLSPEDAALLADLSRLAAVLDPPPESVVQAARETLTWLRVDAELAELLSDSAVEEQQLALVRGDGPRVVSFETPGLTIEVEILQDGPRRTLVGQLVPPMAAEVELRREDESRSADADERGRFRFESVAAGLMRLRIAAVALAGAVETSWIAI
jgi:hypothetical protein